MIAGGVDGAEAGSLSAAADGPPTAAPRSVSGVVLCGGRSTRMGRDKARLAWGGGTLVERAVATLEPLCGEVLLASGEPGRYPDLARGRRVVADPEPGLGPLAGIAAALAAAECEVALVLACDVPGVGSAELERLLAELERTGADACLLESGAGIEPLVGAWRTACAPALERALAGGVRKPVAVFEPPYALALAHVAVGGDVANLNTPEDYERARAEADA